MEDRDVYRELQVSLDRMPIPYPATESGVEIRILKALFTPKEAEIALFLSAIPETLPVIHKRLAHAMSQEALGEALDGIAGRGAIQRHETPRGPVYGKSPLVLGMYEGQVNRLTPEFERDFRAYLDEGFGEALHAMKTPQMRTIPVHESVRMERGVASYDDVRAVVRESEGPFALLNCICRQGRDLTGDPCHQTAERENCLLFGAAAKTMAESGQARTVSREEMLRMLDHADEEGLVLQPQNTRNPLFVCCCCGCCCGVLTSAKKLPRPADHFDTNFYAEVDAELCLVCGTCAERCQMEAVSNGEEPARVDLARCIGCGLCITTCSTGAIRLFPKEQQKTPPNDTAALYKQIFRDRYGPAGMIKAAARKAIGLKV